MQGNYGAVHPAAQQVQDPGASQSIQYNREAVKGFGITQIIIGIVCFILNTILLVTKEGMATPGFTGYGIWGGTLFFVAGLLQVLSADKFPNKCLIIGTMVMCIIAACVCSIVLSFGILEIVVHGSTNTNKSFGVVIAFAAFGEAVIAITSSALCCCAVCKCSTSSNTQASAPQMQYNPSDQGPMNPGSGQ